ncbi:dihydrofolate reductase family protein [Fibrivirga algicola]|uniref:Dihydrofolate reductase family protein n=1 Tax=Fibrivirga algicola TaxID=2950420 RepID=A0ABX0QIA3_9BACT|nr:dihydrofolate reductase family protein [Fibrivirga algicola]NID12160.1 dihydrofolate reductase family protein [Fibrivirga algicola]
MRTLKLQVQATVDGFMAGPTGEMDWLTVNWTDDIGQYVAAITEPVDTILLGRNLAQGFIPHWATNPELPGADKINSTHKVVFTKTLDTSPWERTRLATGDLAAEINALKNEPGGDMIVYGGGTFVASLIKAGLIDELHLFINPVALGTGMAIFNGLDTKQNLTLVRSMAFECGIIVLCYEPKRA